MEKSLEFSDFEDDLIKNSIDSVANKYLFDSFPYCFKDKPDLFFLLREEICSKFNVHPKNFCIVGSGKTGFSLNPKRYGKIFNDASDIDIVLISDELFLKLWLELLVFKKSPNYKFSGHYKQRFNELQNSLFYGIIRLDKLSNDFSFAKEWWDFFNKLSIDKRYQNRTIRGAIFKTWQHVSEYYEYGLSKIKNSIEVTE